MHLRYRTPRSLALAVLLFICSLSLIGCGTVRVSGALNSSNLSIVNGTVSFVQFTAIMNNNGSLIDVTVVTLFVPPGNNTFTFCGNQTSHFAMNSSVQVSFTSGQPCSGVVAVVSH